MEKGDLFMNALEFATEAHAGMVRKHRNIPFILHPMEAAAVAASMTDDREVLAAALLHDTIEDAGVTEEELREKFGERVTTLVLYETEDRIPEKSREASWKERKEGSLRKLAAAPDPAVKILFIADKLSNMRSFYHDYLLVGSRLWDHFHEKDPAVQEWYYRSILSLTEDFSHTVAWQELKELTDRIFA